MSDFERVHLGGELRRMREDIGLTGVQVATAIGWTQSKFSRVETGRFSASLPELARLLDFYGVAEDVRAEMLARSARSNGVEGAWIVRAGGPRARHVSLSVVESRAVALYQFQAAVIPGLLQTPAYAQCHVAYFDHAARVVMACRWMVGGLWWRVLAGSSGLLTR